MKSAHRLRTGTDHTHRQEMMEVVSLLLANAEKSLKLLNVLTVPGARNSKQPRKSLPKEHALDKPV